MERRLTSLEICAGAGGQALGLEQAGFRHVALVEIDPFACATLRHNRPSWNVLEADLHSFSARPFRGTVDLFAGGVPCPPFSKAGKQLGPGDERDLFPEALRLIEECEPRAVMLENVRGLLDPAFDDYRDSINTRLRSMGFSPSWRLLHASDYGVPQLRPRVVCVAMADDYAGRFDWPTPDPDGAPSLGDVLLEDMAAGGWAGADEWARSARGVAPTLVGGSKKHGGPDLGPTRARRAWASLGVDGGTLAERPPSREHTGMPRLTVPMAAKLQGFPSSWEFAGRKTHAYRQVGNAFPPPVARAVGEAIRAALQQQSEIEQGFQVQLWRTVDQVPETSFAATSKAM